MPDTSVLSLAAIADAVLDEAAAPARQRRALDEFVRLCSDVTGVQPDPSFDGWARDIFLDNGVAINPRAAAHCVVDYRRTLVFMQAVYAAIKTARARFPGTPLRILYAGCGPYATLLLPLLEKFKPAELEVCLLDIHQRSLHSVRQLLGHFFGSSGHQVSTVLADACSYRHSAALHLIIAETMQKSLEQEPQVAVTANLAPQLCAGGIFIPQKIDVQLCLAHLDSELAMFNECGSIDHQALVKAGERHPLATVFELAPDQAASQLADARKDDCSTSWALPEVVIEIPGLANVATFDPLLYTRIQVFAHHVLREFEAEITLPQRCYELLPIRAGAAYAVSYRLGNYPKFEFSDRVNLQGVG